MKQKPKVDPIYLRGTIPGISMTAPPKGRPWKRPPQFNTVEEVVPMYISALTSAEFIDMFLDSIEQGIPVTTLVDIMLQAAVMEGKHTIDVSILVAPIVMEAFLMLAEKSGVDYVSGLEPAGKKGPSKGSVRSVVNELFNNTTEEQAEAREEVQEAVAETVSGPMSKRS